MTLIEVPTPAYPLTDMQEIIFRQFWIIGDFNDYGQSILVGLTLYTDQTTGIVTTDIAAFEKHMGES